jgi:HEAT repeat protein
MMKYFTIILVLCSHVAQAQIPRFPEPVPSAAAQMFEQLATGDWSNWIPKAEALDYLSRYDVPGAAAPVKAILEDTNPNNCWLRGRALVALARIDAANAGALVKVYSKDPHPEVRAAAAEVCAELPKGLAEPIIQGMLEDKTPLVHFHVLAALARHQGEAAWTLVAPAMSAIPDNCIEPAARALGWIGTEAARTRLLGLAQQGESLPLVLRGLEGITAPSLAPLYLKFITLSGDKAPLADMWQALHRMERSAVIAACREALVSGDEKQVQTVARLMASYLKEPELGESLQAAMEKSKDRTTLLLGLSALSCVEANRFRALFVTNLAHADAQIRISSIRCLAQCKDVNLYDILGKVMTDPEPAVRIPALEVLRNAPAEQMPSERVVGYFTPSLLSPDTATRQAAIAAVSPRIDPKNGAEGLAVMRKIQEQFGTGETKPLMDAVFRMVPDVGTAAILEGHGFVAKWHVIGEFPAGFGAPVADVDGFATAYPPEQKIDLSGKLTVSYNTNADKRYGKAVAKQEIAWVPATVENADGILFMTKAGRSQLVMPLKHGVSYAFTEINIPAGGEVRMAFLFNMNAQKKVWLNGAELKLESNVNQKEGTDTATAKPKLAAGKNSILVKVVTDDGSAAWWAQKVSTRGFSLTLTDTEGKPLKWSHE